MNKIEKRSDLYREWARVLDMCEGTKVNSWKCVKWYGKLNTFEPNLLNTANIDTFEFAIAVVEDKPVFVGDVLYTLNGHKITVIEWMSGFNGVSWNPPKPKIFNLNGVELPIYQQLHCNSNILSPIHSNTEIVLSWSGLKEDDILLLHKTFKDMIN